MGELLVASGEGSGLAVPSGAAALVLVIVAVAVAARSVTVTSAALALIADVGVTIGVEAPDVLRQLLDKAPSAKRIRPNSAVRSTNEG